MEVEIDISIEESKVDKGLNYVVIEDRILKRIVVCTLCKTFLKVVFLDGEEVVEVEIKDVNVGILAILEHLILLKSLEVI